VFVLDAEERCSMVHVLNLVHDATLQKRTTRLQEIQGTILKRLESGQLKPGDLVDSERELAKIHCVNLMTARHALSGLECEGIVVRRLRRRYIRCPAENSL
jgi:DNA-binding GntR family transcriptional regulator